MKEIIYAPVYKKFFIYLGLAAVIMYFLFDLVYGIDWFTCFTVIFFSLFGLFGLSFEGRMKIDESGFSALNNKGEVLAHVPWTDIPYCKVYANYSEGNPKYCICFKRLSLLASIEAEPRKNGQEVMSLRSDGDKLCDIDLRKLCFGRMTPEAFASKDMFGFLVNDAQGEQIRLWWSQASEGGLPDLQTQA